MIALAFILALGLAFFVFSLGFVYIVTDASVNRADNPWRRFKDTWDSGPR